MKLTDAIERVLKQAEKSVKGKESLYEATKVVGGHLRHLRNKEKGTQDGYVDIPGVVHSYVEYHHALTNSDIGVAYNENRVWVCIDGVSLFRAKAEGDRLFSEYHPRHKEYVWQRSLKSTCHQDQVEFNQKRQEEFDQMKKELEELRNETLSGN